MYSSIRIQRIRLCNQLGSYCAPGLASLLHLLLNLNAASLGTLFEEAALDELAVALNARLVSGSPAAHQVVASARSLTGAASANASNLTKIDLHEIILKVSS